MFSLYMFALLVGGALLVFSLLGQSDADSDVGNGAFDGDNPVQWLSFRTAIYFLFVFGGVGAVLSKAWVGAAAPLVLVLATAAGLGVGAAVAATFGYLRKTDSGLRQTDDSFIGLSGRITLPIAAAGAGKVLVSRGDRTFELLARPYDKASGDPAHWQNVIVVEMDRGTARVAPRDDPAVRELAALNL